MKAFMKALYPRTAKHFCDRRLPLTESRPQKLVVNPVASLCRACLYGGNLSVADKAAKLLNCENYHGMADLQVITSTPTKSTR